MEQSIPKSPLGYYENVTLSAAPPGIVPDVANRKFHGQPITVAAFVCLPIVVVLSIIRIYHKACVLRKWGMDDYVFAFSVPAGISMIAVNVAMVQSGARFGYHAWDLTVGDLTKSTLELSYAVEITTGPIFWLVKLTLFCLLMRVFQPLIWLRRLALLGIAATGIFYFFIAIHHGIACRPRGGLDRASVLLGQAQKDCYDPTGFISLSNIPFGAFNLLSDIYILVIPLPAIVNLKMDPRKKVGVLLIFLTGLGACIASAVGVYFRASIYGSLDFSYDTVPLITINIIEISVGMIIPTFASVAQVAKIATHACQRFGCFFSASYGWDLPLKLSSSEYSGTGVLVETEIEIYLQDDLRQEKNDSQFNPTETIEEMV